MTKDELIREARVHVPQESHIHDMSLMQWVKRAEHILCSLSDMLSRAIVWQDGEPPKDGKKYLIENRKGFHEFVTGYVSKYSAWITQDNHYIFSRDITRHAILTQTPGEKHE